jgi:hypothetical protein
MRYVKFQSRAGQDEVDIEGILFKADEVIAVADAMADHILKNVNFVEVQQLSSTSPATPVVSVQPQSIIVPKVAVDALDDLEAHHSPDTK